MKTLITVVVVVMASCLAVFLIIGCEREGGGITYPDKVAPVASIVWEFNKASSIECRQVLNLCVCAQYESFTTEVFGFREMPPQMCFMPVDSNHHFRLER